MNQRKAGVIFAYLTMGANSIIQLLYVPMLLYYLSKDQYGIYQLMGSLIAYLSIMDFGLSNTTTRYLSMAYAGNDKTKAQAVISTSQTLYSVIAAFLIFLGVIFYFLITPIYGKTLSPADLHTAKCIFLIMLLNIAVTIPSHIFTAAINANERFIFLRGLGFIKTLLQPLLVWGILAWKSSVLNLVLMQTGFNFLVIFINYLYCKKKLHISFSLSFVEKPLIKELTGFSIFIFIHAVMDQIYWRLGQLVLGATSGALAVSNYAVALQVTTFAIFLPSTMSTVFLPKLSAIIAKTDKLQEVDTIFCKIGRLEFMFMMLLLIGFAFMGKTFITLWVGADFSICYYIAFILMASYVLDVSQHIGIPILQAMKKHSFRAYISLIMCGLNIVLSIPLAKCYGEIGCAVATAICLIIGSVSINWYYIKVGLNIKQFFYNLLLSSKGVIVSIITIACVFYFYSQQNTWLSLFLHGLIIVALYLVIIWKISFNSYEKQLFSELSSRIFLVAKYRNHHFD